MNSVHVSVFSEWFDKQKEKAMGIIWTGWRLGALTFPLIRQWLLEEHGFAKTLHVLIPPMLTLLTPAVNDTNPWAVSFDCSVCTASTAYCLETGSHASTFHIVLSHSDKPIVSRHQCAENVHCDLCG
ncbi:uncharacterized protein A1O9_02959 [Exophiala aquamarina CBS 119918]|uniref:Uncharacterized protein n=1 Tax=Exophiala aquamarina CBS 119918 TaxID=1182545 RepID=A0A072PPX9_9EURO|nr:uncharacterized protein A1O9_02959 [Exophiala aquamarina CBS 119918]KEF61393.1 hypothetical protein A1O9_02959 [Exophiala aquamarina CBS 119918]